MSTLTESPPTPSRTSPQRSLAARRPRQTSVRPSIGPSGRTEVIQLWPEDTQTYVPDHAAALLDQD